MDTSNPQRLFPSSLGASQFGTHRRPLMSLFLRKREPNDRKGGVVFLWKRGRDGSFLCDIHVQ